MSKSPRTRCLELTIVISFLAAVASCWVGAPPATLLPPENNAPVEVREGCVLAERKCATCHSIDRVMVARVNRPHDWRVYVDRMRRMSASGISEADGPRISRCLIYRSFGESAIDWSELQEEPRATVTNEN